MKTNTIYDCSIIEVPRVKFRAGNISIVEGFKNLPFEPKAEDGLNYFYISNGKYFQIYAHLEGKDEAENDPKIARRNIPCGSAICNFGRSSGDTPLDKSLEEYENELLEELKGKGVNIQK